MLTFVYVLGAVCLHVAACLAWSAPLLPADCFVAFLFLSLSYRSLVRSLAAIVTDRAVADTKLLASALPPAAAATAMALALLTTVTASDMARAEFPDTPPATIFFDEANVVPPASETQIVKSLTKLGESSGLKVRFVMMRSLPYGTLPQEYADELFNEWGLGDKDVLFVGGSKVARGGKWSSSVEETSFPLYGLVNCRLWCEEKFSTECTSRAAHLRCFGGCGREPRQDCPGLLHFEVLLTVWPCC